MHATFFTAEFTDDTPAIGEHTLRWLLVNDAPAALFHACHAWAATWQAHQ